MVPSAVATPSWSHNQRWSWLVPGPWWPVGPFSVTFTYTVTFSMQDGFGNAYPASTSTPSTVVVSVSADKLGWAVAAKVMFVVAATLFVLGLLAAAGVITIVGALVLFAAAGIATTICAGLGLAALDPPVPDFEYGRTERVDLSRMPRLVAEDRALAPLAPVFALLARMAATTAALSATEARLLGARIDRDRAAIDVQTALYAELRDSLLAAAAQVSPAVADALEAVRSEQSLAAATDGSALQETFSRWTREGLSPEEGRAWQASGVGPEPLRSFELASTIEGFQVRPLDELLAELANAVAPIASDVQEQSDALLR